MAAIFDILDYLMINPKYNPMVATVVEQVKHKSKYIKSVNDFYMIMKWLENKGVIRLKPHATAHTSCVEITIKGMWYHFTKYGL